jgi:hypothetical protein
MLVGIDMGACEILLAERLQEKGNEISLVLAHRTECGCVDSGTFLFHAGNSILERFGIPSQMKSSTLEQRLREVREQQEECVSKDVNAARLLDIPYICVHTPADNLVTTFLKRFFDEKNPQTLGEMLDYMQEITEFAMAEKRYTGPAIKCGTPEDATGKIFVDMIGGTQSSPEDYQYLKINGFSTVVSMHVSEEHRATALAVGLNLIDAGYLASDTLGMNLLLDKVFMGEEPKIIPCSGYARVKRDPISCEPLKAVKVNAG